MNKNRKINIFKLAAAFICIFVMVFSIFTIVRASSYSVLIDDDFWHGYDVGAFHVGFLNYVIASLRYAKHMYFNWQGTYFSMFLQALLSPVNNYGLPQLRIVMIFNAINFFFSFILFLYVLLNRLFHKQWLSKLVVCTCAVFAITSYNAFEEVFYWFSGATSYTFPISLLFYSLTAILSLDLAKSKRSKCLLTILAIIPGILAMGGSLTVAATGCCFMLLICIYELAVTRKISVARLTIFASYFVGALINAAAPGNFIRQETSEGEGLQIIDALKNSFLVYESNLRWLFHSTNFSLILLVVLLCGLFLYEKIKVDTMGYTLVSVVAAFVPLLIIFPAVLGYNVPWIPNRCVFVVIVAISLIYINLALVAGYYIMHVITEANRPLITVITIMLIFVTASLNNYTSSDYMPRKLYEEISDGTLPNYYAAYVDMIHRFESSQGTDLRLAQSEVPEEIDNFYCFNLSDDPDSRTNVAISYIYQLNSVSRISE